MQTTDWIAIYLKNNNKKEILIRTNRKEQNKLTAIPKSQPDILYDFGQHS